VGHAVIFAAQRGAARGSPEVLCYDGVTEHAP
jgi:hypothetical protein